MKKVLRIGTRGSPLALIQANLVRDALINANPDVYLDYEIEIVPIRTSGDWKPEQHEITFMEMGGDKGLFTKEIEEALLAGTIDMAVHSMKDVPSWLPNGLEFCAMLKRNDARDAFFSHKANTLDDLPHGACVGTSSLRRQAQILARRPDLKVAPLRGNVETRLRKLSEGMADATILALAGLERLGIAERASSIMDVETMLPAAAQGAIGIEIRSDDDHARRWVAPINHAPTRTCITAERAFLQVLEGSCRTPIAAYAHWVSGTEIKLCVLVAKPDGSEIIRGQRQGSATDAETLGAALGAEIKLDLPLDFFAV